MNLTAGWMLSLKMGEFCHEEALNIVGQRRIFDL